MRPLISIGRFSELTGLSIRALRLYEQAELLRPAVVDPHTGYRFYRWHQKAAAERIRTLRDLEVPLDLIAQCLNGGLSLEDVLAEHEANLHHELLARQQLLGEVQAARTALPLPEYEVQVREQAAQPLLTLRYRTSLAHCEADRREGYQALQKRATRLGTHPAGPPHAFHPPQGGFNPDDYLVALCLPVQDAVTGTEPGYSGLIAYTQQKGDLTRLHHAYQAVAAWLERSEYVRAGPAAERYLCHLKVGRLPHTEIWQPIQVKPIQVKKELI